MNRVFRERRLGAAIVHGRTGIEPRSAGIGVQGFSVVACRFSRLQRIRGRPSTMPAKGFANSRRSELSSGIVSSPGITISPAISAKPSSSSWPSSTSFVGTVADTRSSIGTSISATKPMPVAATSNRQSEGDRPIPGPRDAGFQDEARHQNGVGLHIAWREPGPPERFRSLGWT